MACQKGRGSDLDGTHNVNALVASNANLCALGTEINANDTHGEGLVRCWGGAEGLASAMIDLSWGGLKRSQQDAVSGGRDREVLVL